MKSDNILLILIFILMMWLLVVCTCCFYQSIKQIATINGLLGLMVSLTGVFAGFALVWHLKKESN